MKLTTTNDVVSSALAMVAGAVIKKSTVPIMAGVKIAVEGDVAILETFNYSGERRRVAFTIDSNSVDGMCVVNHEQFSAIIAKLPGNVTLSLKGNDLIIRGGEFTGKVSAYPIGDWHFTGAAAEMIDGYTLELPDPDVLAKVGMAASTDESRPTLTHIMLRVDFPTPEKITDFILAATDGYRLTTYTNGNVGMGVVNMLIPRVAANGISKLASVFKSPAVLHINHEHEKCVVEFAGAKEPLLWAKLDFSLGTDRFPNYEAIVPADNTATLTMLCSPLPLLAAVDRAVTFKGDIDRVILTLSQSSIQVARSVDTGGTDEIVPLMTDPSGAFSTDANIAVKMGFSGKYLMEGLGIFPALVTLRVTQPTRPMKMTDGGWIHVLMPMMIS